MTDSLDQKSDDVPRQPRYFQAEQIKDLDRRLMEGYSEVSSSLRWFDPARPHAISHIRRQAKRLSRGYADMKQGMVGDPFHDWLDSRSAELGQWHKQLKTLPDEAASVLGIAKKVPGIVAFALYALPLFGIPVGVTSFSALVLSAIDACFCALIKIIPLAVSWAVLGTLVAGFTRARDYFLGGTRDGRLNPDHVREGENLYEIERDLTMALGQRPRGEIQIDVLGWFALAVFFYFYDDIVRLFSGDHFVTFSIGSYVYAAFLAAIGLITLVRSLHRRYAWRGGSVPSKKRRRVSVATVDQTRGSVR
jgi:hypothetical protein